MKSYTNDVDPVRANTKPETLKKIDEAIEEKIHFYSAQPREVISQRILQLEREWDIERVLEANAASLALSTLALGIVRGKKYLVLTGTVLSFLLMHAMQGWCPPVPVLRKLGVRTRSEIDREKFALKVLRGDFQDIHPAPQTGRENSANEVISAVKES